MELLPWVVAVVVGALLNKQQDLVAVGVVGADMFTHTKAALATQDKEMQEAPEYGKVLAKPVVAEVVDFLAQDNKATETLEEQAVPEQHFWDSAWVVAGVVDMEIKVPAAQDQEAQEAQAEVVKEMVEMHWPIPAVEVAVACMVGKHRADMGPMAL